jgi:hypothetical protein
VTPEIVLGAGALAALAVAAWLAREAVLIARGSRSFAPALFMLTHFLVFTLGYVWIADFAVGWLVVNTWHNAQYVALVWHHNNVRFRAGVDPEHPFLSTISQRGRVASYLLLCMGIAAAYHFILEDGVPHLDRSLAFPVVLVLNQSINFHHYIVDALIWKVRRPALRENLGLV